MLEIELTDMENTLIQYLLLFADSVEREEDCIEFAIFSNNKMVTVTLEWHEV